MGVHWNIEAIIMDMVAAVVIVKIVHVSLIILSVGDNRRRRRLREALVNPRLIMYNTWDM
jgi:hypothetical protein